MRRHGILPLIYFALFLGLAPAALLRAQTRLDTTSFVVLGEGLAAGMANYGLQDVFQRHSFPAQMARQMGTIFPQPLMEGPGIGDVLGYQSLPVRIPTYHQGRVRVYPKKDDPNDEAPTLFVFNLSVPNFRVGDALGMRPLSPLIHNRDPKQTSVNLILGFPSMIFERGVPLWSQYEYARAMNPTLALVELGYFEALEAAVAADPALIPDPAAFRASYSAIVRGLRERYIQVVVTTIPDPMDTAYFNYAEDIGELITIPASIIAGLYGLGPGDAITREGLTRVGNQLIRRDVQSLEDRFIVRAATASQISSRVAALNVEIARIASENGAVLYDMAALFRRVRRQGVSVGNRTIKGNQFGGFYSLDGYYPGPTGHALIANDILSRINSAYGESFPLIDLTTVIAQDPVAAYEPARRPPEDRFLIQREPAMEDF